MRKKRLVIVHVPTQASDYFKEKLRQKLVKDVKEGVIVLDNTYAIECIDYDSKEIEVQVITKEDDVIATHK